MMLLLNRRPVVLWLFIFCSSFVPLWKSDESLRPLNPSIIKDMQLDVEFRLELRLRSS
jgi:hypothetical protein